jgi:2'-5' RNA ligase superfamily
MRSGSCIRSIQHKKDFFNVSNNHTLSNTRQQLTLFIDPKQAQAIEAIRKAFNPQQQALIASHVTLCREDEIIQIDTIKENLARLNHGYIRLQFGAIIRFAEGKGVLMPAIGNNAAFDQLRNNILTGLTEKTRIQEPHITLLHPRNATCTNEIFEQMKTFPLPDSILFKEISLIEQEPGKPWKILEVFALKADD